MKGIGTGAAVASLRDLKMEVARFGAIEPGADEPRMSAHIALVCAEYVGNPK
jgi:hypothetical protein